MQELPTLDSIVKRLLACDEYGGVEDLPILQIWVLLHLAQEVRQVGIYVGSLQENLQHVDDMLREAANNAS